MELDKLIIKFIWNICNNKGKFWGGNCEGIVILPDIKIYYKVLIIKTVVLQFQLRNCQKDQRKRRESSVIFK